MPRDGTTKPRVQPLVPFVTNVTTVGIAACALHELAN